MINSTVIKCLWSLPNFEGRGNGIKTRIVNCYDVALALHRLAGHVCKFFGCELDAQTKIDYSEGIYIVNGSFQQNVLQDDYDCARRPVSTNPTDVQIYVACGYEIQVLLATTGGTIVLLAVKTKEKKR